MRRFELSDGKSNKFWEIKRDGSDLDIRWGRIGTQGQSQTKTHASDAAAQAAMDKLIKEKTGKGYAEVGDEAAATPAAPPAAPQTKPTLATAREPSSTPKKQPVAADAEAAPAMASDAATTMQAPAASVATVTLDAQTPPWLADGEPFEMPQRFRSKAFPSRRFPQAPAPAKTSLAEEWVAWNTVMQSEFACDFDQSAHHAELLRNAWLALAEGPDGRVGQDARVREAVLGLCMSVPEHWRPKALIPTNLVDAWIATSGLEVFVRIWLGAQEHVAVDWDWRYGDEKHIVKLTDDRDAPLGPRWACPVSDMEWTLRTHLSDTDAETYTRCEQLIRQSIPALSPVRQVVAALMLPDAVDLAHEVARRHAALDLEALSWLMTVVTETDAITICHQHSTNYYYSPLNSPSVLATLLQERRLDALPVIAPSAASEEAGHALKAFGMPEAIQALTHAGSTSKGALQRLSAAVERWPLAAIAGLANVAAAGGKDSGLAEGLLLGQLHRQAAHLPAFKPWLAPAANAVIDKLLQQGQFDAEPAPLEALPAVLRDPPWLQKRKVQPREVLELAPLELTPVEEWDQADRDAALVPMDWMKHNLAEAKKDPNVWLQLFSLQRYNRRSDTWPQFLSAMAAGDAEALAREWIAAQQRIKAEENYHYISFNDAVLAHLPGDMGAVFWNAIVDHLSWSSSMHTVAARYGLKVLPALITLMRRFPGDNLGLCLHFGVTEIAPAMARSFTRLKTQRQRAKEWLLKFPAHAATGLLPDALGKNCEARDNATTALRMLANEGRTADIEAVAERYGDPAVVAATKAMLAEDPLQQFPAKIAKLPAFWQPQAWHRPLLAHGEHAGQPLPDSALDALGNMLAFPTTGGIYPGIAQVRDACTRASLADFAWDLFNAWLVAGSPSKESWAMSALGLLGNDDTARKLTPFIRAWPGESQHQRAVNGLDVLATIGSDIALMQLNGIAQKVKFKGLQDRARDKIEQIADDRGMRPEELEDRLAPDLGLDAQGTLLMDFGARRFRVGFDEALKPFVRDEEGARLAELPKPRKSDDESLAKEATDRWKLLKKDARTIAAQQVLRLEMAMVARRRWERETFETFLAGHPLLRHLVQRLVWGVYPLSPESSEDDPVTGELTQCFRVSEDGQYTDANDDPFELPEDAASYRIGIPHALELDAATAAAFGQLFTDYELLPPFTQLGRETFTLTDEERKLSALVRWKGKVVPTGRILGLVNKGWRRGDAQDGGGIWYFTKDLPNDQLVELDFQPGIIVGMVDEYPEQTLEEVKFGNPTRWGQIDKGNTLGDMDPVSASELIRDLQTLVS